jgi:hypothetical protein
MLREAIEQPREESRAHGQWQFQYHCRLHAEPAWAFARGRRPVAYEGWRFEVVDLDGRCIDKILATPPEKSP